VSAPDLQPPRAPVRRPWLRPLTRRRLSLALAMAAVGTLGALLAVLVAGTITRDVGPFSADLSLQPSLDGGTEVAVPPLGQLLLDTHDRAVCEGVWSLYEATIKRLGPISTLIEWDAEIPPLPQVAAEADKARALVEKLHGPQNVAHGERQLSRQERMGLVS